MPFSTSSLKTDHDAFTVLNAIPGLGNRRVLQLLGHFGSPLKVLEAFSGDVLREMGFPEPLLINIHNFDVDGFLEKERILLSKQGARRITLVDEEYPPRLKMIADAPAVLYVVGEFPKSLDCAIAIVGARSATMYGLQMAEKFSCELAELGAPIISGLARGIDAAAHRGCLKAGGATVAVLGCGLDVVYPRENKELFAQIKERGCLISEFPFGTPPLQYNFPRRNRIVSGLSLGVVVIEARLKSGALITADFALEQGREVFAVPGRVDSPLSQGPHALIRQGAHLVLSVEDILQELPVTIVRPEAAVSSEQAVPQEIPQEEKRILDLLQKEAKPLEVLEGETGVFSSGLMGPLLSLQIKKLIRELPGKIYERVRKK